MNPPNTNANFASDDIEEEEEEHDSGRIPIERNQSVSSHISQGLLEDIVETSLRLSASSRAAPITAATADSASTNSSSDEKTTVPDEKKVVPRNTISFMIGKTSAPSQHTSSKVSQYLPKTSLHRDVQLEASLPGALHVVGIASGTDDDDDDASVGASTNNIDDGAGSTNDINNDIVSAYAVDEEMQEVDRSKMEKEIISRFLNQTSLVVEADAVQPDHDAMTTCRKWGKWMAIPLLLLVLVIVGVAVMLALHFSNGSASSSADHKGNETTIDPFGNPTASPTLDTRSTLDVIRERGVVRCGVYPSTFGFTLDVYQGVSYDHCRALSTAVFGTPSKAEMVVNTKAWGELFFMLANKTVDVITDIASHNMGRDVFHGQAETALTFSNIFYYAGGVFGGVPEFVDCAENLDSLNGNCRNMKVCFFAGTSYAKIIKEVLPGSPHIPAESADDMAAKLTNQDCNVVISSENNLLEMQMRDLGYDGPYKMGTRFFSRGPRGIVSRGDDSEWSNLVNLVINTLISAEAANIGASNAEDLLLLLPDNIPMASIMASVLAEVGNYGDIYSNQLEPYYPRHGLNLLYTNESDSGLLYSFPFGQVDAPGPDPMPGMTLNTIMERDYLRCGVQPRMGFATLEVGTWVGFDVEFCRGVAAAIFAGDRTRVEFLNVSTTAMYSSLADGDVDLVARARVSIQANYHEPTTGAGYSFSSPYFYNNSNKDAFALMTRDGDSQWSDFVFWVVMAIVYAEENDISQASSLQMPVVTLFGDSLKQMLRDCAVAVGSYSDLYNRTLEPIIPRSGANLLNKNLYGPQLYPIPFV